MSSRPLFRAAAAAGLVLLAAACGSEATAPEVRETDDDVVLAPPSASNPMELLIQIAGGGAGEDDPAGPAFTLSVPASLVVGQTLSRTITIGNAGPFVPFAAVDYGDGGGPRALSVNGGPLFNPITGEVTDDPYTVTLHHQYAKLGTFTVAVAMSNHESRRSKTATLSVVLPADNQTRPSVAASIDSVVVAGQPLSFTAQVADPDVGGSYGFAVSFGDGATSSQNVGAEKSATFTHTYEDEGSHTVRVIASDGAQKDTLFAEVRVEAPNSVPTFEIDSDIEAFVARVPIQFRARVLDLDSIGDFTITVGWGDGVVETRATQNGQWESFEHAWQEPGTYTFSFAVSDGEDVVSATQDIPVEPFVCAAGSWDDGTGCVAAAPGSYVDQPGATGATPCAPGTFQPAEGQTSCVPSPVGSYVDVAGATAATPCPVGSYQDQTGQIACVPAPAGSFVGVVGAAAPTICAPGRYQPAAGSASCLDAQPGHFVADAGAAAQAACPAGAYQPAAGATGCVPAPVGSYVDVGGAASATPCPVGSYQDQTGQIACVPAPAGSFVGVVGAAAPTICAPGRYQPAAGSASCLDAQPGHFVADAGAAAQAACPTGTYQPAAGQTSCVVAPVGSYVDLAGAASATACPAGTSTLAAGSTSAADCLAHGTITLIRVDEAIDGGGLVPADPGRGGANRFAGWIAGLERSVDFLDGPQHQAGCAGLRDAYRKADGEPSPKDDVAGPARAQVAALLLALMDESGCAG